MGFSGAMLVSVGGSYWIPSINSTCPHKNQNPGLQLLVVETFQYPATWPLSPVIPLATKKSLLDLPILIGFCFGGVVIPLIFPKVPQSSLGILRVLQLPPPPLEQPTLKKPAISATKDARLSTTVPRSFYDSHHPYISILLMETNSKLCMCSKISLDYRITISQIFMRNHITGQRQTLRNASVNLHVLFHPNQ